MSNQETTATNENENKGIEYLRQTIDEFPKEGLNKVADLFAEDLQKLLQQQQKKKEEITTTTIGASE
jgi:rubrerythrin